MGRLLGTSLTLLLAIFCLASMNDEAHAQKDKKKVAPAAPAIDSATLSSGEYSGTLKNTPNTDRGFTLVVETQVLVNTGKVPKGTSSNTLTARIMTLQSKIAADQTAYLNARTAQQRSRYYQNLQRDQQQLQQALNQLTAAAARNGGLPPGYKVDVVKKDVDFQTAEVVKVRTMVLPTEYDDKGNKKTYTKKELEELKGKDKNLPGYESALDKLEAGMKVRVVLAPAPTPKKDVKKDVKKEEKDKEPAKDKDSAKDTDPIKDKDEMVDNKRMQVKQIIILEEAPGAILPKGKK